MSNLLSSLRTTANALSVFERALIVSQNNVTNASTPGYAAQRLSLQAMDFEPGSGLVGGVQAGEIQSARSLFAEQAVRHELGFLGYSEQQATSLTAIEPLFGVSGDSGIPGAMNRLFQSFSAWSVAPNSAAARQTVLERAQELAEGFQQTAAGLAEASSSADRQLRQTVDQINQLGSRLVEYNAARRAGARSDAGLDAKIQTTLEELSQVVDFTTVFQADGSVTVLLGGQSPLVIGEHLNPISVSFSSPADPPPVYPSGPPSAHVLNSEGREITSRLSGGSMAGLLDFRNNVLASLRGDAYQPGDLNVLAKSFADRVNEILTGGQVEDGPPPVAGVPLFAYDTTNETTVAQSIRLAPGIAPELLAPIAPGPPYVSNGTALTLASLSNPQNSADKVDGLSFVAYYGSIASRVGRGLADAKTGKDYRTQSAAQARSLRSQLSGVSLDEEAILITEFQRAYQAAARVVSTLNSLADTVLNMYQ